MSRKDASVVLVHGARMIVEEFQRFMSEHMKAHMRSHPVDHTPLVTAPAAVVEIVREAPGTVASR